MIGNILGSVVRIANAPIRAAEDLIDPDGKSPEDERIVSAPLDRLAEQLESIDEEGEG